MGIFDCISGIKEERQQFANVFDMNNLSGKVVVSSPNIDGGGFFNKSVVLIVNHDSHGSIGVMINRVVSAVTISMVFKSLQIDCPDLLGKKPLYFGGPVESQNGLILHTGDYQQDILMKVNDNLMISSNTNILKNIATGEGPANCLFLLGYSGWKNGQLESEIRNGQWIVTDLCSELIFLKDNHTKYKQALASAGVRPGALITGFGNA